MTVSIALRQPLGVGTHREFTLLPYLYAELFVMGLCSHQRKASYFTTVMLNVAGLQRVTTFPTDHTQTVKGSVSTIMV